MQDNEASKNPQKKGKTKKRALWCVPIIRFHVGYMQFMMPNEDLHKKEREKKKELIYASVY